MISDSRTAIIRSKADAVVKRMAAFDFFLMSCSEWHRAAVGMSACNHANRMRRCAVFPSLFDEHIEIATENLNEDATSLTISLTSSWVVTWCQPPKTHLNASVIDISSYPKDFQIKMNWLLGRLNTEELAQDNVYAVNYFLEKFVAWSGYQITDAPQLDGAPRASKQKIAADLERAAKILKGRLRDIDELYQLVRDRGESAPSCCSIVGKPRNIATVIVEFR